LPSPSAHKHQFAGAVERGKVFEEQKLDNGVVIRLEQRERGLRWGVYDGRGFHCYKITKEEATEFGLGLKEPTEPAQPPSGPPKPRWV
jgi:hypothetical protein